VKTPFFRIPFKNRKSYNITLIIILLNVVIYYGLNIFSTINPALRTYLSLNPICFFKYHFFWQPVTYMFLHGSTFHLLSNMFTLLLVGIHVEKALGSKEFCLLYFLCGIFSGICSTILYWFTGAYNVLLVGASGSIYGLLLAFAVIFPKAKIYFLGFLPIPAPVLILFYIVIELAGALFDNSGVAHFAHLFGILAAWIYFPVRWGISPIKLWKDNLRR